MTRRITIRLPWPPTALHPGVKRNIWARSRTADEYQKKCGWLTWNRFADAPCVNATLTFHPPDGEWTEADMVAAFAPGLKGVAFAMRMEPEAFLPECKVGEVVAGGQVIVEIENEAENG